MAPETMQMRRGSGFHFVLKPWRFLIGFVLGVAVLVLLQQYSVMLLTTLRIVLFGLLGALIAGVLPTLASGFHRGTRFDTETRPVKEPRTKAPAARTEAPR